MVYLLLVNYLNELLLIWNCFRTKKSNDAVLNWTILKLITIRNIRFEKFRYRLLLQARAHTQNYLNIHWAVLSSAWWISKTFDWIWLHCILSELTSLMTNSIWIWIHAGLHYLRALPIVRASQKVIIPARQHRAQAEHSIVQCTRKYYELFPILWIY